MIDTLPLTLASLQAETEDEAQLCKDLAFSIVQGSPYARKLYESCDARKVMSEKSVDALGDVLRAATKHFVDLRAKRRIEFSTDNESSDKESPQMMKATSFAVPRMGKVKKSGHGVCRSRVSYPGPKPPVVCALMCSEVYGENQRKRKGKGKMHSTDDACDTRKRVAEGLGKGKK